jgi:hypothetical protein
MASSDASRPSRRVLIQSMAAAAAVTLGGRAVAHSGPPVIDPRRLFKLDPAVVYRLRTRKTRACAACRRHHQYTLFRSHAIANANRAHVGCNCPIIPQAISRRLFKKLFPNGSQGVALLSRHPRGRRD